MCDLSPQCYDTPSSSQGKRSQSRSPPRSKSPAHLRSPTKRKQTEIPGPNEPDLSYPDSLSTFSSGMIREHDITYGLEPTSDADPSLSLGPARPFASLWLSQGTYYLFIRPLLQPPSTKGGVLERARGMLAWSESEDRALCLNDIPNHNGFVFAVFEDIPDPFGSHEWKRAVEIRPTKETKAAHASSQAQAAMELANSRGLRQEALSFDDIVDVDMQDPSNGPSFEHIEEAEGSQPQIKAVTRQQMDKSFDQQREETRADGKEVSSAGQEHIQNIERLSNVGEDEEQTTRDASEAVHETK